MTGGAGFVGSHLVDTLVETGHAVTVLDDLSTGQPGNVHGGARLVVGSVVDAEAVTTASRGVEIVFHLAALGAVARSVRDPVTTDRVNVHGTLNLLTTANDVGARRVIFASSSSVYGGAAVLPTPETVAPRPRSPYAVSKLAGEWYCRVMAELFPLETVSLRYFNVFGPRQRPDSSYAAVIPRFASSLLAGDHPTVYGDGLQSRDFTYVADVVTANLAAAAAPIRPGAVYNIAPGDAHTLLELLDALGSIIGVRADPIFDEARPGDIYQSRADARAAGADLGWSPQVSFGEGLARYVHWLRTA